MKKCWTEQCCLLTVLIISFADYNSRKWRYSSVSWHFCVKGLLNKYQLFFLCLKKEKEKVFFFINTYQRVHPVKAKVMTCVGVSASDMFSSAQNLAAWLSAKPWNTTERKNPTKIKMQWINCFFWITNNTNEEKTNKQCNRPSPSNVHSEAPGAIRNSCTNPSVFTTCKNLSTSYRDLSISI